LARKTWQLVRRVEIQDDLLWRLVVRFDAEIDQEIVRRVLVQPDAVVAIGLRQAGMR
jgi:hypothetical protein